MVVSTVLETCPTDLFWKGPWPPKGQHTRHPFAALVGRSWCTVPRWGGDHPSPSWSFWWASTHPLQPLLLAAWSPDIDDCTQHSSDGQCDHILFHREDEGFWSPLVLGLCLWGRWQRLCQTSENGRRCDPPRLYNKETNLSCCGVSPQQQRAWLPTPAPSPWSNLCAMRKKWKFDSFKSWDIEPCIYSKHCTKQVTEDTCWAFMFRINVPPCPPMHYTQQNIWFC